MRTLITVALCGVSLSAMTTPAFAQAAPAAAEDEVGLTEIVVTAQKREQRLQDVPIAVSAFTTEELKANRIFTVNDLSALAPGVTVKPSAGGISTPNFMMRGQVSLGVVAGSDKQVSIYVDGVYISSPRGSIFELPDVERIEVLRGPQGTLFGRNATAGAVSVTTRDPSGDARVRLEGGFGNRSSYRLRGTVETPQFGMFSALFSYVRDYRRGDIRNAGAGTVWDRSASPSGFGVGRSPKYLGTRDTNSYFVAAKFEPSDTVKFVYKYDRADDKGTPEGTSFIGFDRSVGGGLAGGVLTALYTSNNVFMNPSAKRPDIVANSWATKRQQRVQGHSLTTTWDVADNITVKNIAAYRKANVFVPSPIDGVSGLTYTQQVANASAFLAAVSAVGPGFFALPPAAQAATLAQIGQVFQPNVGKRLLVVASNAGSIAKQWSDEIQVSYRSEKLQATVGAQWFHSKDEAGGPEGIQNTFSFNFTPNCNCIIPQTGVIPLGNEGRYFPKATSIAAYAQFEYKVTPEIELVAGARITHDKKTSKFRWDVRGTPRPTIVPPKYTKTKPNFLVGVNWKPNDDTLLYGKYSTSFVSGGSTGGIVYAPETAKSVEFGVKADMLDRRLRANVAIYHVIYNNFQGAGSTSSPSSTATILPTLISLYGATTANELVGSLSTFVFSTGKLRAQGLEAEITAAPVRGMTLGGSFGYTDAKYKKVNAFVLAGFGGRFDLRDRAKYTASLFGSYETEPVFGDATLLFRTDAQYRSSAKNTSNALIDIYADRSNIAAAKVDAFWVVNGRAAIRNISIGGTQAELAVWGKNIFDHDKPLFVLITPLATSANYGQARSFGVEMSVDF